MANRRMFSRDIVMTDSFIELPAESKNLYFTLGILADDDGFVGNPKSICRQIGIAKEEIDNLVNADYIIKFDSGVICIRHWRINNFIRKDRYTPTNFKEEFSLLNLTNDGLYELNNAKLNSDSPSIEEIKKYIEDNNFKVNSIKFFDYYSANRWKDSNGNAINWKQKVILWDSKVSTSSMTQKHKMGAHAGYKQTILSDDELEKLFVNLDQEVI